MEGAAQIFLGNAGQLVGDEFRLLRCVGGEVDKLRDELATMNALLRMNTEVGEGCGVDHFVREWMKQVRELAYDAEDCVHLYIFRIKCTRKLGVFVWCKRQLARLWPRYHLAVEIKALRARAVAISERHARYGVSRDALSRPHHRPLLAPVPLPLRLPTHALRPTNDDPAHLVGVRDQAIQLANKVKAMDNNKKKNPQLVFSIVGFGGLGKTTLAMEVCRQLEMDFDRQAMVSVSQTFDGGKDLQALLKRVLQQVAKPQNHSTSRGKENAKPKPQKQAAACVAESPPQGSINNEEANDTVMREIDTMDVAQLGEKLNQLLQDKRYLIVVDDVWTISAWDAIQSKLPRSEHGRIIVTTQIDSVAKQCSDSTFGIHHVKKLSSIDSKKLFISKAFGSVEASCPKELEITMDMILNKCDGLPLAIISTASLLASYQSPESKYMWDTVCKSFGSQMESSPSLEEMRQIITLSYNHLPYHLKCCMMSLSIFPEDYEIKTIRLLYRWIAEGLVYQKRGLTLMEVAESYFDELVSRSMIIPASFVGYNGRTDACRVHDMMLEVMVSISLEANFVSLVGGQYEGVSYDRIRRLSIHEAPIVSSSKRKAAGHAKSNGIERMNMKRVRSLTMFEIHGKHNVLSRLREFTLLRVLDLEGCNGLENKHVEHICRMYLLRFLSLRSTQVSVLPKEIGELEHLQILDVDSTLITDLPEEVTKLERLEHVHFSNKLWRFMWTPPQGLCKMKALREVNYMIVTNVHVAREVGELGQLRKIGIWVFATLEDILQELCCSLSKIYSLRSLTVGYGGQGGLNFLLKMESPPWLLQYLDMDGYINELPNWVGSLAYLTDIHIMNTHLRGDEVFGVLYNLPNLQNIWLGPAAYTGRELVARASQNFPVLTKLYCSCKGMYPGLRFERGSMDKLMKLTVEFGAYMSSLVGIENLPNIKDVELIGGRDNPSLVYARNQLTEESNTRPEQRQFKVGVRY